MPPIKETIKGILVTDTPGDVVPCGMSRAKFAKRNKTGEWYELMPQGSVIGTPTEFDFYRQVDGQGPVVSSGLKQKELTHV